MQSICFSIRFGCNKQPPEILHITTDIQSLVEAAFPDDEDAWENHYDLVIDEEEYIDWIEHPSVKGKVFYCKAPGGSCVSGRHRGCDTIIAFIGGETHKNKTPCVYNIQEILDSIIII